MAVLPPTDSEPGHPNRADLPRLAVVGDVAPAATFGGHLMLHRLLREYPPDRLLVIEGNLLTAPPAQRLAGVQYQVWPYSLLRLHRTRFRPWVNAALNLRVRWLVRRLGRALRAFQAGAVLSIVQGHLWLAAAEAARDLNLPLHLLIHDDWEQVCPSPARLHAWHQRVFRDHLRHGSTWLGISPNMADEVRQNYGVPADVLYACRGTDAPPAEVRVRPQAAALVGAYAGSIRGWPIDRMLFPLAELLREAGGSSRLYCGTPLATAELASRGIQQEDFSDAADLARKLEKHADFLFLPLPFSADYAEQIRLAFPSKLADYTAMGLPIVAWAPAASGLARWCRENPRAILWSKDPDPASLRPLLEQLRSEGRRRELAAEALAAGQRYFAYETARDQLWRTLIAGKNSGT